MDNQNEIIYSGILRKKGGRLNVWGDRYFVLKNNSLFYYLKSTDVEPRGSFPLFASSQVSSITSDLSKKKKQFMFTITWPYDEVGNKDEESKEPSHIVGTPKDSLVKSKSKAISSNASGNKISATAAGGAVVGALTSGVGFLTGMAAVGVSAATSAAQILDADRDLNLLLATFSYHEAESWVNALESIIHDLNDANIAPDTPNTAAHPGMPKRSATRRASVYHNQVIRPEVRLSEVEEWITTSKWKVYDVFEGLRLLEIVHHGEPSNVSTSDSYCMRVDIPVNASAADTFSGIINFSNTLQTGIVKSIRIVEVIDNFTDIIHLKLEPVYIYPTWTGPRDFCLIRYWKDNRDGSYVICLDSTQHPDVPLLPGYIRGELHCAYATVPPKVKAGGIEEEEQVECLLTFIAQLDPKGWIWESFGYSKLYLKNVMLHVLDVKDSLDCNRFLQVQFDRPVTAPLKTVSVHLKDPLKINTDSNAASNAHVVYDDETTETGTVATIPQPLLSPTMWKDSDASTFKVRGATYMSDKVKANSAASIFKFIGIDLYETDGAYKNIASHPKNRVNQALQRGEDSWIFVVNFIVPGSPCYSSFVCYFLGDKKLIEADTPFGSIARPFFNGNDDEFRNNRFKLIPKVVDGNMMIKMAVKDTPTLIGNKLKQSYFKGDNYFEVDIDVGSSSVARNACGLAIGYSKAIVVDMGFVLQGNEENELPEVLMGCCSCYRVDMSTGTKLN